MRESLSRAKDVFLKPFEGHFGNESFVILIQFQGSIDSTDEILSGLVDQGINQIEPFEEGNRVVNNLLKFQGVLKLLFAGPHELYELLQVIFDKFLLIEQIQFYIETVTDFHLILLYLDQLVLIKDPLQFSIHGYYKMKVNIQTQSIMIICWPLLPAINKSRLLQMSIIGSQLIIIIISCWNGGAGDQGSARGLPLRQSKVWEGVEIEAERCGEVHGLRLSNPLQEENHRPQRTNSVLSHMILYTPSVVMFNFISVIKDSRGIILRQYKRKRVQQGVIYLKMI